MRLYVMRHGPAEDHAPSGRDFDRRLTPAGREVVRRVAVAFHAARAAGAPTPLRILTSPRVRARETATILRDARVPASRDLELRDALGGDLPIPFALIDEAAASGVDTILVGHQPRVEELVAALVGSSSALAGFATATIVELTPTAGASNPEAWTLVTLLESARLPG
jgi:phosphohistidine phosphatase